jgi:hypothetical protein
MKGRFMNRRTEATSTLALFSLLLFSAEALTGCCTTGQPCQSSGSLGPSNGEVIGIIAGTGVAITAGTVVAVNHAHHTLKGCASTGPDGLELETDSDKKTYSLVGITTGIQAGEVVKLHGNKVKKHKDNPGHQEFLVQKVTKDYGPCKVLTAAQTPPATPQATATRN